MACSYRDLITLKLILVSGLYPQVAISDEFNHLKVHFGLHFCCISRFLHKLFKKKKFSLDSWSTILSHRSKTLHISPSNELLRKQSANIAANTTGNRCTSWHLSIKATAEFETSVTLLFVIHFWRNFSQRIFSFI